MKSWLVVNIDELWLKGRNRGLYFTALRNHLAKKCRGLFDGETIVKKLNQRFILSINAQISREEIECITQIPGISSVQPALKTPLDKDEIVQAAIELFKSVKTPTTFKVETKRSNKNFEMDSMELSRYVGHHLLKSVPDTSVDVHKPEVRVNIFILDEGAFMTCEKYQGIGGLPVGTSGKILTLISGGLDSPVASVMMSKRGCAQDYIFFYAYPYVGDEVREKIIDICSQIGKYQSSSNLYIIPFGDIQKKISETARASYRTMLFRKLMVIISNKVAKIKRCQALLTGDNLGQVSSQTMGNLTLMDMASDLPIFRPLIGLNKSEIISLSRRYGTHKISLIPHDDACALFAPKNPIISPDHKYWEDFADEYDFSVLVKEAIDAAEKISIDVVGNILTD
ncbi:MAG: tRNA 4-thiouridine(8) synthase ThiI [Halobacteriovoraceae bacterium]|nr:tRNA 4-thiouridine(8) synthase ThiI [Halobacteriovoraceae bacterium]